MREILIIGYGVLGKATHELLKLSENYDKFNISILDTGIDEYKNTDTNKKFDLAFICINLLNNSLTDPEFEILKQILETYESDSYILRSTVVPLTTKRLRSIKEHLYYMPEYLREATGFDPNMPLVADKESKDVMEYYFKGSTFTYFTTTALEFSKLIQNSFFAMKVTYFNMIHDLTRSLGVDYDEARNCFMKTARYTGMIHDVGTMVPFNGKYGYGGKCLPKDLITLYNLSMLNGSKDLQEFLSMVHNINQDIQAKNESIDTSAQP